MSDSKQKLLDEYSGALKGDKKGAVFATGKAKFADYSEEQLKTLPDNIAENSFGCGNPLAFSHIKKGQTVLDLGCGAGMDLLLASQAVGVDGYVIGVDMNVDMLKKAHENIKISGITNIKLKQGAIERLPIKDSSIDWVLSNCVINLSSNKELAFSEIARVLKPSGKMLVSDIVAENLPWWVRKSGVLKAACAGGVISERQYLQGLKKAGLRKPVIEARNYYEASQLASIVVESLPVWVQKLSCCGKHLASKIITWLARPIAKNLWSVKVSAQNAQ